MPMRVRERTLRKMWVITKSRHLDKKNPLSMKSIKHFRLTEHARFEMTRRQITQEQVRRAPFIVAAN